MKKIKKAWGLISGFDGKPILDPAGTLNGNAHRMNIFATKKDALATKFWDVFPLEIHYEWPPKGRMKRIKQN